MSKSNCWNEEIEYSSAPLGVEKPVISTSYDEPTLVLTMSQVLKIVEHFTEVPIGLPLDEFEAGANWCAHAIRERLLDLVNKK